MHVDCEKTNKHERETFKMIWSCLGPEERVFSSGKQEVFYKPSRAELKVFEQSVLGQP